MVPFLEFPRLGPELPIVASVPHSGTFVPDWLVPKFEPAHRPYHRRLAAQLAEVQSRWGRVYLLDLHSFFGLLEADVCLGNGSGTTCAEPLLQAFELAFQAQDFATVKNRVFTGGYITRHYAAPQVETLQIELRYTCYHDCSRIDEPVRPVPDPARISSARQRLERVFGPALERLSASSWASSR